MTELLNSYQQKIGMFSQEIDVLKQQLAAKDRELDQMRIQLKNLKRSRSLSEPGYHRATVPPPSRFDNGDSGAGDISAALAIDKPASSAPLSASAPTSSSSSTTTSSAEAFNDEMRLLRNKIARLEDDLHIVTHVSACEFSCFFCLK